MNDSQVSCGMVSCVTHTKALARLSIMRQLDLKFDGAFGSLTRRTDPTHDQFEQLEPERAGGSFGGMIKF